VFGIVRGVDLPDVGIVDEWCQALKMSDFSWFSDDLWPWIEPLLPVSGTLIRRVEDPHALSGMAYVLQSGRRWGDGSKV
jgi:hypothetical protein